MRVLGVVRWMRVRIGLVLQIQARKDSIVLHYVFIRDWIRNKSECHSLLLHHKDRADP